LLRSLLSGSFIALILSALLVLPACHKPEDDVRAQYEASEAAIAARDMAAYRGTLSTASIQHLEETLTLARTCSVAQTKKLPCERMAAVLALRNRVAPDRLKKMQVLDYLQWMQSEQMYFVDEEVGLVPYKFKITGDQAVMQYGMKVEKASSGPRFRRRGLVSAAASALSGPDIEAIGGMVAHFVKIEGFWYHDLTKSSNENYDVECAEEAKAARLSLPDYMASKEKEEAGKLVKNVWAPVATK
jgi:hypothetical protein